MGLEARLLQTPLDESKMQMLGQGQALSPPEDPFDLNDRRAARGNVNMGEQMISTRREFLHRGMTLVGAAATVPVFLQQTAYGIARPDDAPVTAQQPSVAEDRILVVIQLAGGNDGLNTVIPFRNDLYYQHRPKLAIARDKTLAVNDELGLHPAARGLKALYDAGDLAIIQGAGYPNPNRSHFKSTDIWATADPNQRNRTGWVGRYFDNACSGEDPMPPQAAIALTPETPLALSGQRFRPFAFQRPDSLRWTGSRDPAIQRAYATANAPASSSLSTNPTLAYLQRVAMDTRVSGDEIRRSARGHSEVRYPRSELAASLQTVARLIAAERPTRVYYASLAGFDTHSNQAARHQRLMQQLGDALDAFVRDLHDTGHLDRVVIMAFSEFGRRVTENGAGGTDHGEAAPMFLLGGRIKPGVHGAHPNLETLHRGDLAFHTDFRRVYATILAEWMRTDADAVLAGTFDPLPLIRT